MNICFVGKLLVRCIWENNIKTDQTVAVWEGLNRFSGFKFIFRKLEP
jgi:hypothetical protein